MRESQLQQEDPMDRYKVREMLCGNVFRLLNDMGRNAVPAIRQRCAPTLTSPGFADVDFRELKWQAKLIPSPERAL